VKPPIWVLRDTVVAVQEQLLAAFGGASGIRDAGLVESALAPPVNRCAYERTAVTSSIWLPRMRSALAAANSFARSCFKRASTASHT
jgi:hypothetical protein